MPLPAMSETAVKWTLTGPRTSKWCISYLAIEGLGFEGHHERLRQVTRADLHPGHTRAFSDFNVFEAGLVG